MTAVSVIMSVYNGEAYLEECIRSILRQTYTDFEFIIIDDGSTDKSLNIIKKYANEDQRVIVSSRPNKGLIASLNEAAALASGDLLARMDADDVSYPNRFEEQVNAFEKNESLIALGTYAREINAKGTDIGKLLPSPVGKEAIRNATADGQTLVIHPTLMMKSSAFNAIGGYRANFKHAEDKDLLYRMVDMGEIDNLPLALLQYRVHGDNISVKHGNYQEMLGALIAEMYAIRVSEGRDISEFMNSLPELSSLDEQFRRNGLRNAVIMRMMNPFYVGSTYAIEPKQLQIIMEGLSLMDTSSDAQMIAKSLDLKKRIIKTLIKERKFAELLRFTIKTSRRATITG